MSNTDKHNKILKSAREVLANLDTDEFLDKFLKIQTGNYYPNFMVLHDLAKEELYSLAESVSDFGVVVIPIYTRGVYEVVDFSDYNHIDFSGNIIRPLYVGDNKELEREVVIRTINMIYEQIERKW